MKNTYKIYEVRFPFVNFSIVVDDSIIVMSPSVSGFIGMEFEELQTKVKLLNGHINRVNYAIPT